METLLTLDLATRRTGWAHFDMATGKLLAYGAINCKLSKEKNELRAKLRRMQSMAAQVAEKVEELNPTIIIIEEITGSKNRLGQKTLDIMHGLIWLALDARLHQVSYYDVSGAEGWRTHLGLKLSPTDKQANLESRKINKRLSKKSKQLPIINMKDLAIRYVNNRFELNLTLTENDIADAISMGSSYINRRSRN